MVDRPDIFIILDMIYKRYKHNHSELFYDLKNRPEYLVNVIEHQFEIKAEEDKNDSQ